MVTPFYRVVQLIVGQENPIDYVSVATYESFEAAYEFCKYKNSVDMPQHTIDQDGTIGYVVYSSLSPKYTLKGIEADTAGKGTYIEETQGHVPGEIADYFIQWYANSFPYYKTRDKSIAPALRYIKILEV